MSKHNLELLAEAARLLKPLLGELVFVGGSTTALLITDKAAAEVRPTYDVVRPAVVSRMEKTNQLSGVSIKPSHVRPLEAIAMDTGEGEIFKFSFAAMLSCNDVIDLEGRRMKS